MNSYIYTDRGLCCVREGVCCWLTVDELTEAGYSSAEEVYILIRPVEYRLVDSSDLERKAFSIFPDGYVMRHERLKGGKSLVMGVREEVLNRVYELFPGSMIKGCIPYGIGVRSLLLTKGILQETAVYLVVEDAGERVFITALSGFTVLETREIPFKDTERLIEEVKRSEKHLLERSGSRGKMMFVSNHPDFVQAMKVQRSSDEVIPIEGVMPVFEVLTRARFGIHFSSPHDEAAEKRRSGIQQRILFLMVPLILVLASVIPAVSMKYTADKALLKLEKLQTDIARKEAILRSRQLNTYQDQVRESKALSWEETFMELTASIPAQWQLENIVWESGFERRNSVSVLLFKRSEAAFSGKGVFKYAAVNHEITGGRPAVRVVYEK